MIGLRKKIMVLVTALVMVVAGGCGNGNQQTAKAAQPEQAPQATAAKTDSKVIFVNASRSAKGNTYKMGEAFLAGVTHETVFLNDYKIYQLGQNFPDDQLKEVLKKLEAADTIVIGSPVYWHTMSGPLKTFIDRLYPLEKPVKALAGKKLYFLLQGAAPSQETLKQTPYIMSRVANQYDMKYMGAVTDPGDMSELQAVLKKNL